MKILTSVIAVACLWVISLAQDPKFEKQAVALVQRTPVSTLEENMPRSPFADWLKTVVGAKAGIVWQLSECEQVAGVREPGDDIPACVDANALLPDGRKVIVRVAVGTFKKGITGDPGFYYAIIEQRAQLFSLNRLRDLPEGLRSPDSLKVGIGSSGKLAKTASDVKVKAAPDRTKTSEESPPPPSPPPPSTAGKSEVRRNEEAPPLPANKSKVRSNEEAALPPSPVASADRDQVRRVSEGALMGAAIRMVGPIYPASAKMVNARGEVQVLVTISETGKVVDARAVSGHLLLRKAAVTAAREWVFTPTKLNGIPVSVQGIITFDFPRP